MCGGSSAKTDRTTQLASEKKLFDLGDKLSGQGADFLKSGTGTTKTGLDDTAKASKYYSDILSGDPSKVLAAVSPQVNAVTQGADQEKKQLANLPGNRTGGTNATTQNLDTATRGKVADTIAQARPGAAAGVERTGAEASKVGLAESGIGAGLEGQAEGAFSTLDSNAIASRGQSQKIHDAAVQQWADLVSALLVA